jgi:8-oxo-dGTP diphosphatase
MHMAYSRHGMTGLIEPWTGRTACALQAAMRLSNEAFAERLGIAVRTVATWHQRPDLRPKAEMQQLLDTALEQAPESARARFATLIGGRGAVPPAVVAEPGAAQVLTVAVAIVVHGYDVLLVQRRTEDGAAHSWQFPAGMVKPGMARQHHGHPRDLR